MLNKEQALNKAWWQLPTQKIVEQLATSELGLSSVEASARIKIMGQNKTDDRPRRSLVRQFLSRFTNPLVLILLVAALISALTGEMISFLLILSMVVLSIILDFVQEYKADQAAGKLLEKTILSVDTLRDGVRSKVKVVNLVPGDVVFLSAGDVAPADGVVIRCNDFFVNQSQLTGEAYPIEKKPNEIAAESADINQATHAVFMGSGVVTGSAQIIIVKTGAATQLGFISKRLTQLSEPSAFEVGIRQFGVLITRLTVLLVLFAIMVNAALGRSLFESFLFAIALAVGLTPELLPMVVSVTLASGAMRMAAMDVIVKKLSSIHNLGAMDVLCMDKTGTLTESKICLTKHFDTSGRESEHVLMLAYLNSYFESGYKSPLDEAILGHHQISTEGWRKIDEVPFDFERRRLSVLLEKKGRRILVMKGAPEDVISSCRRYESTNLRDVKPIKNEITAGLKKQCDDLSKQGLRVLGIAWREVPLDHPHALVSDETDLIFSGFAVFIDPLKKSVISALHALASNGITLKIVTGDSELVTQHLCKQLGLLVTGVVTGADLEHMDRPALQAAVERANLFCRMNPGQKERVITALRANGHVVGYLGDGVNDAPSIHVADIGLSVDSAADVAKAAADIILLNNDLSVLNAGVVEGRRTFTNVTKYILMGTSSNFGNMFSMAGATLFLPFLPMLPVQILLNNMLYDFSEITIPADYVDASSLTVPCKWDMRLLRDFMITMGILSSAFDFITFFTLTNLARVDEAMFHTGWFIESLATQVLVIFVIRTKKNLFSSRPHAMLAITSLSVVLLAIALPFMSVSTFLGFVRPSSYLIAVLMGIAIVYLICAEFTKRMFYLWYDSDKSKSMTTVHA